MAKDFEKHGYDPKEGDLILAAYPTGRRFQEFKLFISLMPPFSIQKIF